MKRPGYALSFLFIWMSGILLAIGSANTATGKNNHRWNKSWNQSQCRVCQRPLDRQDDKVSSNVNADEQDQGIEHDSLDQVVEDGRVTESDGGSDYGYLPDEYDNVDGYEFDGRYDGWHENVDHAEVTELVSPPDANYDYRSDHDSVYDSTVYDELDVPEAIEEEFEGDRDLVEDAVDTDCEGCESYDDCEYDRCNDFGYEGPCNDYDEDVDDWQRSVPADDSDYEQYWHRDEGSVEEPEDAKPGIDVETVQQPDQSNEDVWQGDESDWNEEEYDSYDYDEIDEVNDGDRSDEEVVDDDEENYWDDGYEDDCYDDEWYREEPQPVAEVNSPSNVDVEEISVLTRIAVQHVSQWHGSISLRTCFILLAEKVESVLRESRIVELIRAEMADADVVATESSIHKSERWQDEWECGVEDSVPCEVSPFQSPTPLSSVGRENRYDRTVLLFLAKTLDRTGRSLQEASEHLSRMAERDVAELPNSTDEGNDTR